MDDFPNHGKVLHNLHCMKLLTIESNNLYHEFMAFFLCKLISPRKTFPQDMTIDEGHMMQNHLKYWKPYVDRGVSIVLGPVIDPNGVWGMGVMKVDSESELQELLAKDPVILANRGFRYEILPMANALYRE